MKLELVKQFDPVRNETWFIVKLDENEQYFINEKSARERYELLKTLGNKEKEEIVLDSCEISANLEENK